MRTIILLCLLCAGGKAMAQDSINPVNIQQPCNIMLQNTNVYYCPMAPPGDSDTREQLSNQAMQLRDPNGVVRIYPWEYLPHVYDTASHLFKNLPDWPPCGTPLGPYTAWQRLFTAKDKPDGSHSDIIVGSNVAKPDTNIYPGLDGSPPDTVITSMPTGEVIISKNEDVDFRASGTIKMKAGFHVKPGAFFHAYIEPRWDSLVFSDNFDSINRSKWAVANSTNPPYGGQDGANCAFDSNVSIATDTEAEDGYALDIALREDTCQCNQVRYIDCDQVVDSTVAPRTWPFSTGIIQACRWPLNDSGTRPAYEHAPYGKYEFRDKTPKVLHHTNNWGFGAGIEYDLCESWGGNIYERHPNVGGSFRYGPFKGKITNHAGTYELRSADAGFCLSNNPAGWPAILNVNGFALEVASLHLSSLDTFLVLAGNTTHWNSDVLNSDSVTFYYQRSGNNTSDKLSWHVEKSDGKWRKFYAPYRIWRDSTYRFSKTYQPTSITLHQVRIDSTTGLRTIDVTLPCHWDYSVNHPTPESVDSGIVWLDSPLADTDKNNDTLSFDYVVMEAGYPGVPIPVDTTEYKYHVFVMELLPHEARFLVDGNVYHRMPDRLVPRNSKSYDWISNIARSPITIDPAEFTVDDGAGVAVEKAYYENAIANNYPGCFGGAAHHRLDYVRVWDVPRDYIIPHFPH